MVHHVIGMKVCLCLATRPKFVNKEVDTVRMCLCSNSLFIRSILGTLKFEFE